MKEFAILPPPTSLKRFHIKAFEPWMIQWAESQKISPVLLITGPNGVGKRTILHHIAQWILCKNGPFQAQTSEESGMSLFGETPSVSTPSSSKPTLEPCNTCKTCQGALKNQWIDFLDFTSKLESSDARLKIEDFEILHRTQGHGGFESPFRIFLIPQVENLSLTVSNSLLKLLEEPPPGWIFFLTATDASLVLATLTSRSQKIRLLPLSNGIIEEILSDQGITGERAQVSARLAQGSLGKALRLTHDDTWDKRKQIAVFFNQPEREMNSLIDWASKSNTQTELLLDQLSQMLMDLIRFSISDKPDQYTWENQDVASDLKKHATGLIQKSGKIHPARAFWLERFEKTDKARQTLLTPVNKKLLIQDILFPWIRALSR